MRCDAIRPPIGAFAPLRQLRPDHIERMYADLSLDGNNTRDGGLDEKTIIEVCRTRAVVVASGARWLPLGEGAT